VLFLSRPLSTYRGGIAVAVAAILGWVAVKFVTELTAVETAFFMWMFWGVYGFLGLVVNLLVVSIAVWSRRHFYPIYELGHCQKCGYDLTGNVSGRCPECGTTTAKGDAA